LFGRFFFFEQTIIVLLSPILRVDPIWDNVRKDPAFKALLVDPKNSAPF
jgi:hypothetical protein